MPMSRAERAAFEALRVRAALSWPPPPPEPVIGSRGGEAWDHLWWFNVHSGTVGRGVTNWSMHSTADYTDEQLANRYSGGSYVPLTQQAGGPWYRSKADALRALHCAIAQQCAERLAALERYTEEALADQQDAA